jgi:hypothetical protein
MAQIPDSARLIPAAGTGYVDWGAILGGTVLAVALSVVLLTFGSAIGLSVVSFEPREGASLFWLAVVSGLWFTWVAVTSFGAGGYLAGRLRRPVPGASVDEIEVRDGAHGLLVWATGALLGAVLATSGITGAIGATGTVAQSAAEAVGGDLDYIGSRLGQGSSDIGEQAAAVISRAVASGSLAPEDRDYLTGLVARSSGQTPEQAGAAVDAAFGQARQAYDKAVDTAEHARVAAAIAAFLIAATLLVSAAAAYLAAAAGGEHRDRGVRLGR